MAVASDLRCLVESFRHGARKPIAGGRTVDYFGRSLRDAGTLTEVGREQHLSSGKRFREKYQSFLSSDYSESEIKVQSTDYERTTNSALYHLRGLYSKTLFLKSTLNDNNTKSYLITDNSSIKIPITILDPSEMKCEVYKENQKIHISKAEGIVQFLMVKYGDILEENFSIENNHDFETYKKLGRLVDDYISAYTNDQDVSKIEPISKKEFYDDSMTFHRRNFLEFICGPIEDFWFARMLSTNFFEDMVDFFDRRIKLDSAGRDNEYTPEEPKMQMFSVHDSTISSQLSYLRRAFGVKLDYNIPYASELIYELRREEDQKYYVDIYYQFIEKIFDQIPYELFKEKTLAIAIPQEEIDNVCQKKSEKPNSVFSKKALKNKNRSTILDNKE